MKTIHARITIGLGCASSRWLGTAVHRRQLRHVIQQLQHCLTTNGYSVRPLTGSVLFQYCPCCSCWSQILTSLQYTRTGCAKKVTPFWYLSFLPLLDALFAIFVYLHIIFIKCLISEPSVIIIQMDSPAGWCTIEHCEQHDKLPQKGECFIHRASDAASKQPRFKPRWLCCWGCS